MSARATVEFRPEEDGPLVTFKACWSADFRGETAVFVTQEEAVEFCWKRWRVPADEIRIIPAAASGERAHQ